MWVSLSLWFLNFWSMSQFCILLLSFHPLFYIVYFLYKQKYAANWGNGIVFTHLQLKKGGITKSSQLYKPNYCIQFWTSNIRGQPNVNQKGHSFISSVTVESLNSHDIIVFHHHKWQKISVIQTKKMEITSCPP